MVPDLMDKEARKKHTLSKWRDILLTRTSETIDELTMGCVVL